MSGTTDLVYGWEHVFGLLKSPGEEEMTSLPNALNRALLLRPQLLNEFPEMIAAIDVGEYVNLQNIRDDEKRIGLMEVFSHLPVEVQPGKGYFKSEKVRSVGGFLLMDLLSSKAIKSPSKLNTIESSTAPLKILNMAMEDPAFLAKVSRAMGKLIRGSSIKASNGDYNEEILHCILTSLGVTELRGEMSTSDKRVRSALKDLKRSLDRVSSEGRASKVKTSDKTEKVVGSGHERTGTKPGGGAQEVESDYDVDLGGGESHSSSNSSGEGSPGEGGDDEDDVYGPLPASLSAKQALGPALASAQPLAAHPGVKASSNDTDRHAVQESGREGWMLTPGDHKNAAGLSGVFDADGVVTVNRAGKFDSGKLAAQRAADVHARKRQAPKSAEDLAAEAMLAEYNALRGPSLMEQHQRGREQDGAGAANKRHRTTFDYQRDIVDGRVGADKNKVKAMVQEAQALSSRFDSGK